MKCTRPFLGMILLLMVHVAIISAQPQKQSSTATAPPRLLLLVHQQFKFGGESERQKLEAAMVRACDRLDVPNSWIDLQSITGPPEALSFDPLDSFEQLETASVAWEQLYASHPKLSLLQDQIRALVTSESSIIAVRRDDLGYRVNRIDLSKARFMRVLEVRVRPGHDTDFVESFKLLGAAYEKIDADMPWVVYQVNAGMPSPTFLVFVPMRALKENDSYLARAPKLHEAEGELNADRMHQIALDAYESTERNLYAISPVTSHVPKEFIDSDPDFWSQKPSAEARPQATGETGEASMGKGGEAHQKQSLPNF
ncbi:MAG TPA: hypothetical protein VNH65_00995 [Candidatus Acidoferrum sp.]|nr:hypothetical protein [Candidatus Acidoferrum sp.]